MDSQNEREELLRLKREQERLQGELGALSHRLQDLEKQLQKPEEPATQAVGKPPEERKTPPPVPEAVIQKAAETATAPPVDFKQVAKEAGGAHATKKVADQTPEPDTPAKAAGDWELNLGKVWFVRVGVGLLLTGLVFLSLYAYQNWFFYAPALVKVSCFFAVSLLMVGGGYALERWREHLRQYGQVLSAGGLAAGYYTIYAAHFVPALKVIGSPIAAGVLLCLWAGGMLVYAAWRQGRILAVMSIGLAYYATVVNPSGWISLFSSLVLSAAAMILLMRYRWVWVGAVGLVAAYLSHAFWLGLMSHEVTDAVRITYLCCTWLLFAVAMQVPQAKGLNQAWRRGLLGVNNTAFWALLVFKIPELFPDGQLLFQSADLQPHEQIGWISIGLGLGWMLLAALTHWRGGWRREYTMLWGFQGLLIATLGLMIEASGYSRFMMLSCEACILLLAARWMAPQWTRLAAVLCYIASLAFAFLEGVGSLGDAAPGWLAYFFTSLFGFAFVALMRRDVEDSKDAPDFYGNGHRFIPLVFAWTPWAVLIFGSMLRWDAQWTLIGLCGAPLLVAGARVLSGRRELLDISMSSALALICSAAWLAQWNLDLPAWSYGLAALLLALYWWISEALRMSYKELHEQAPPIRSPWIEWVAAAVLGVVLLRWLNALENSLQAWLMIAPLIAVAGSAVYVLTRRYSLAFLLGLFHIGAMLQLLSHTHRDLSFVASAMPALGILAHLALAERFFKAAQVRTLRPWAGFALCLVLAGLAEAQDLSEPALWVAASSALWVAYSFFRKDGASAITGGLLPLLFISMGYGLFEKVDSWAAYLCLPMLPVAALMVSRLKLNSVKFMTAFRRIGGFAGLLILGVKLSRHVSELFDGNGQAITWGLYAVLLFVIGLIFVDRLFRRFGLFYLLIALIHVLLVDVMKLDTLGRILSFLTLGAVLLLLGFLYNQYQDKIRKYL